MISTFRKNWPVILLAAIGILISILNFRPNTWLSGWDNLHPEFNFVVNIKRSIFAVWQEYQGLGLLGGMAHASDLPRQLILAITSVLIPAQYLRYLWTFAMLIIGPIGVYTLLSTILPRTLSEATKKSLGFLGGLFYLANLATVQIFYVPFEAFVTHYGFLPWLLNYFLSYLKNGNSRILFKFFLLSLIGATQSYVPTLFVVYLLALLALFVGVILRELRWLRVKNFIVLILTTFIVNAFWLLPFLYFTFTSADVVARAHQNFIATEDIFLRNKEFGDLGSVAILKGFWFDFIDIDKDGNFGYMVKEWRAHLSSPLILGTGYLLFFFVLIGLVYQLIHRNSYSYALIVLFILPFGMLANDIFPFSQIDSYLRSSVPLFDQVFRVPFTKFGILAGLSYSLLFAFGVLQIWMIFSKFLKRIAPLLLLSILPIIFVFPIFRGYLISDLMELKMPNSYFEVMKFFATQDKNTRIANLPQYTFWGWNHFNWHYRGSGFLWYGIEQPILDRAFDGYSRTDENYYWEMSKAIYSGDVSLFEKILEKYQITWLLFDQSITNQGFANAKVLYSEKISQIIDKSNRIELSKDFGEIKIYRNKLNNLPKNYVYIGSPRVNVEPDYQWNNFDRAYLDYGDYLSTGTSELNTISHIFYPFRSFFSSRQQDELEYTVFDEGSYLSFQADIPKDYVGSQMIIPNLKSYETVDIDKENFTDTIAKYPEIYLDGEQVLYEKGLDADQQIYLQYIRNGKLVVKIPKHTGIYNFDSTVTNDLFTVKPANCNQYNKGEYFIQELHYRKFDGIRLTSTDSNNCVEFFLPNHTHRLGYLVLIEQKHIQGMSLLFSVVNKNSHRADIETYLPRQSSGNNLFVIPPMEDFGLGYILHFDNISFGRVQTINDLGSIKVYPIPYRFLTSLKIIKGNINTQPSTDNPQPLNVNHPNTSYYQVTVDNEQLIENNTTLVLSQSFDDGWKAYNIKIKDQKSKIKDILIKILPFMFGEELKDHVLVNNWENGWVIDNETMKQCKNEQCAVVIVYLPQYLEYIGFLLFIPILIYFFTAKRRTLRKKI